MKIQFRINKENKIVEIFDYDVFNWIKDELFLKDCYEIETEENIQQNMYYVDGTFYDENPNPITPELTFEERQTIANAEQDEMNLDFDYRITMLELGL